MATRNNINNTYLSQPDVVNEPGGGNTMVQYNRNGQFAGDSGFKYNNSTKELSVQGNINSGGWIKGKIYTNVYNFFLTGGGANYILSTDGYGNLSWISNPAISGNFGNGNINAGNIIANASVYAYNLSSTGTAYLTTLNVNAVATFSSVSNVHILGGSNGQVLTTDGTGNLTWSNDRTDYGNVNVSALMANFGSNNILTTGNVTANYILGNGSLLTGLPATYSNTNVTSLLSTGLSGNIIPATSNTYSLGNATHQWNDLYVSNSTIYFDNVPLTISGNVLSVDGQPILSNNSNTSITTNGNITANYFFGNGSQLTGLSTSSISNGTSNVNIPSVNGNVGVSVTGSYSWTFDNTGSFTVPGNGVIKGTQLNLASNNWAQLQWLDTANFNLPDPNSSDGPKNWVFVDSDGFWVESNINGSQGNIVHTWLFKNDGSIDFPNLTVDLHNGGNQYAQTLQFGGSQQAVITGPTPALNSAAQRLIIQGQRGNGTGEGGDVYVWAGDADTNGGDIKIYAGDADNVSTGSGGYINLDGGSGFDGGGQISVTGGYSTGGVGGPVYISAGQGANGGVVNINGGGASANAGGYVNIQGGFGQSDGGAVTIAGGGSALGLPGYGNVQITAGVSTWTFDNTGNLTLPGNTFTVNYANGTQVSIGGSNYGDSNVTNLLANFGSNSISTTGNVTANGLFGTSSNVNITAGSFTTKFDNSGNLILPGNTFSINYANGSQASAPLVDVLNTNGLTTVYYPTFVESRTEGQIVRADVDLSYRTDNNTLTVGNVSVTGNITATNLGNISSLNIDGNSGNVLYGNGVFATAPSGGGSSYSNSNVSALLASFGSNTITTTGNISVGNINANFISATNNITTTGYFISGNQATGGFQLGNSNSRLKSGDSNSYMTMGQNPSIFPDTAASALAGVLIGGNGYLLGNNGARNITLNYAGVSSQVGLNANLQVGTAGSGTILVPGTVTTGVNSVLAGPTFTPLANTMAGFVSNVNNYTQLTIQNKSTGADATTDFVATADNGSDTVNYLDLGIINSGYDNLTPTNSLGNIVYAADSYLYAQGNASATSQSGGNLAIGTTIPSKTIKFFAGGTTSSNIVASIANTGMSITGNMTVSGNFVGSTSNVTLVAGSYSTIFDNLGNVTIPGNVTVNGSFGVKTPNLPAFRVYGSVSTSIASGNTIKSSNGVTVDYNQGSFYDNTTGIFTAPIAGLYHCFGTVRVGTNNGLNQAAIVKNGTSLSGANTIAFWETDTNTGTASHFPLTGYAKCAVGDTLRLYVVAGNVQFDSNDNWGVTYIG